METTGRLALPTAAPEGTAGRLAAAGRHDDPVAFEAAVGPHYGPLTRRLTVVLGNQHDAEDVAQDAYLRAFRSWDRFDGTDVRAWLSTIALRLAFNHVRRRRRWLGILGRTEPAPWIDRSDQNPGPRGAPEPALRPYTRAGAARYGRPEVSP